MTTELMDELRAALLAEHDDHHPISFSEGCGCETCQLLLRVWEHDHKSADIRPDRDVKEARIVIQAALDDVYNWRTKADEWLRRVNA